MKRHSNLFSQIVTWDNLVRAAKNAQRGKRYHDQVLRFNYDLEKNLMKLQQELLNHSYWPGDYTCFEVFDTKRRYISAAPYRDRVIHHAVCQIVMPIFENTYTNKTFANRNGYGTHRAIQALKYYAKRYNYVFKADIRKYFPSIDHAILKGLLRKKIKCPNTLWLLDTIIDASNPQEEIVEYFPSDDLFTHIERRRGIPIGNLTSQHFANIFLNPFDHFVIETLKCETYLRYVDDFVLLSDSKEQLQEWRIQIERFLEHNRLIIHPIKSQIFSVSKGITFLGYRVFQNYVRVVSGNVQKARSRFRELQKAYSNEEVNLNDAKQRIMSWIAHVSHADSWRLREKVIGPLVFQRVEGMDAQGSSGRQLEQQHQELPFCKS